MVRYHRMRKKFFFAKRALPAHAAVLNAACSAAETDLPIFNSIPQIC